MDLLEDKIKVVIRLMDEWNLSTQEKAMLLPSPPTEGDCDVLCDLKMILHAATIDHEGRELSEEQQNALQARILRLKTSFLGNKSPLEFVNGIPANLDSLVSSIYNPL